MKVNRNSADVRDRRITGIVQALSTSFGFLTGAVLGAFALPALIRLVWNANHPRLSLYCGIVGGILGGAQSYARFSRESRRYSAMKGVAQKLVTGHSPETFTRPFSPFESASAEREEAGFETRLGLLRLDTGRPICSVVGRSPKQ